MEWNKSYFKDLDNLILYKLLKLRNDVFIVEQNCPYEDLDNKDFDINTVHLYLVTKNKLIAYARILPPGTCYNDASSIGRVCVENGYRHLSIGKELVSRAIQIAVELWPEDPIKISAQIYLKNFYYSFGFISCGEPYLEDGIEHLEMYRSK